MNAKLVMIAVVLIVAAPILLGYGMALEEEERTVWNDGETKNVTNFLYNYVSFSAVSIDSYALNSVVLRDQIGHIAPVYASVGSTVTPMYYVSTLYETGESMSFECNQYVYSAYFDPLSTPSTATFYYNMTPQYTKNILSAFYDSVSNKLYGYEVVGGNVVPYSISPALNYLVSLYTPEDVYLHILLNSNYGNPDYVDLTAGWYIPEPSYYGGQYVGGEYEYAPNPSVSETYNDLILSIDLASFTGDLAYTIDYSNGADPQVVNIHSHPIIEDGITVGHSFTADLNGDDLKTVYMDLSGNAPSSSNNWYQIRATAKGISLSYVGTIGSTFGAYQAYDAATWTFPTAKESYDIYGIYLPNDDSIIYRGEFAVQKGFDYPVIKNKTYVPKSFSGDSNKVSISQIYKYGSFEWGGETVTIDTNGYYIINGSRRNVDKGIELKTIYEDSTYTNYINGREVSQTATAPELVFNGVWDCAVEATSLFSEQTTSMEWQPGKFAWNGVDSSFALMGLVTCVAVFIGLGMYGRRSGAKVGTLMLICGGAALIFLALI